MMMKNSRLFIFLPLFILCSCTSGKITKGDYKGDGNFVVGCRDYGIAKTYGYDLEFPPFILNQNITRKYTLIDLPISEYYKDRYKINFDIVIGIPKKREDLESIVERSSNMPKEHSISYKLTDTASGKILVEGKKNISDLEPTQHYEYSARGFTHMKSLFLLDMRDITKKNRLKLEYTYDIAGKPTDDEAFFLITLMAPTA